MTFEATRVETGAIAKMRDIRREELRCQIIHYSWPDRGWTDDYLLTAAGRTVGYACVGGVRGEKRDIVTEFFLIPSARAKSRESFERLIEASGAERVEGQTNDIFGTLQMFDFCERIESEAILFKDAATTSLANPGAEFRQTTDADRERFPEEDREDVGDFALAAGDEIVAHGGLLYHYNPPYADIYMETVVGRRRRGYGSYLVQELKRTCYEGGRIPACRCNPRNFGSRATLQKAGFLPCARLLTGTLAAEHRRPTKPDV
jgi:GNAT superfamily N-acetyltransferase